jgi:hypothetical protein
MSGTAATDTQGLPAVNILGGQASGIKDENLNPILAQVFQAYNAAILSSEAGFGESIETSPLPLVPEASFSSGDTTVFEDTANHEVIAVSNTSENIAASPHQAEEMSEVLVDAPLTYIPLTRRSVKLNLTFRRKLRPHLIDSGVEVTPYDD